jgi:hypothetical protein
MPRPLDMERPVAVYWRQEASRVLHEPTTHGGDDGDYLQADQDPATVETAPMLLTEEQLAAALQELRDRLTRLELVIVGMEAKEEAPVELPDSLEYRD